MILLNIKETSLVQGDAQYVYIRDLINQFETVLFGNNFLDPITRYASFIDLPKLPRCDKAYITLVLFGSTSGWKPSPP